MSVFLSILEQWFWHAWDNLWRLLLWNLVLFFFAVPLMTLPPVPAIVWAVLLFGPLLTGTVAWTWPMTQERSPGPRDLFGALGRIWLPAAAIHLGLAAVLGLLQLNLRFYLGENRPEALPPWMGLLFAGIAMWLGLFVLVIWMWMQATLTEPRPEGRRTLREALIHALRLFALHPFISLGVLITAGVWMQTMLWSAIGAAILGYSGLALLFATAMHEIHFEHERREEDARAETEAERRPTSWREIMEAEERGEAGTRGRRPRRSLREIIRPWEM
jgi:hypothetical protein